MLTGELCDELEVVVDVEHGEIGEFGGRCNQQVGDRRRPMLPAFGEHPLQFERSVFDPGCQVLDGHRGDRWLTQQHGSAAGEQIAGTDDGYPGGGSLDLECDTSLSGRVECGGQVAITPMIHTAVASRTDMSSMSIETPTARRAAFVEGQAIRAPTR